MHFKFETALFEPVACTPARIGYIREWLFTPLARFASFEEMNTWLVPTRFRELAARKHPVTPDRSIQDCFAQEQLTLRGIPASFDGYVEHMVRVSGFTYVPTWTGFVYVAFVIATYAWYIVGWRVSRTAHAGFVLDALEQPLHERWPLNGGGLVHHSDRGSQYLFIRYTERPVATRSAWRKRASSPWSVVLATAMTTR